MSYHRVLPLPEPLHPDLARPQSQADALLQQTIMANEQSSTATPNRARSPVSSHRSSSPMADTSPGSPGAGSVDEHISHGLPEPIPINSPKDRARTSSQASTGGRRRLPSITRTFQLESPSDICLCQPDPKVPRPRNAFILYRQHYQAAVVAQNPGLANPEISKVIGEQWRDSPSEVKTHWKSLADEEKLRHQKQHPNYRYQPRRSARTSSLSSTSQPSAPLSPPRCHKCGRKAITASTPSLPTSTFSPSSTPSSSTQNTPLTPYTPSPSRLPPPPSAGFKSTAALLASPRSKRTSFSHPGPQSPNPKRRRVLTPAPSAVYGLGIRNVASPATPFFPPPPHHHQQQRRDSSLPGPSAMFLPRPHPQSIENMRPGGGGFTMGPPPRPHAHHHQHPHPSLHLPQQQQDETLRLPPIQTQTAGLRDRDEDQARGLRAMIQSIGAVGKIKTLARIAPPRSEDVRRGVVVSVEGEDGGRAVAQVVGFLKGVLEGRNEVRVFEVDNGEGEGEEAYEAYHALMQRYLRLSREVVAFISSSSSPSPSDPELAEKQPREREDSSPVSPKTVPLPRNTRATLRAAEGKEKEKEKRGIPIAIIPRYQLSHSDAFACSIPIADAYSPADHWQWMASLWRGVLGPDLTIVVRGGTGDAAMGAGGGGGRSEGGKSARTAGPSVEVRLEDARAILLRVGEDGEVGEGGLRRVGFEVGEWVRGRSGEERRTS